jgi:hypothetical protein
MITFSEESSKFYKGLFTEKILAERAGFEPAVPVRVQPLSRRSLSSTQPSLRVFPLSLRGMGCMTKQSDAFCRCERFLSSSPDCHVASLLAMTRMSGFQPAVPVRAQPLSRRSLSSTQPSLRVTGNFLEPQCRAAGQPQAARHLYTLPTDIRYILSF